MIDSKQLIEYAKQPELALRNLNELLDLLDGDDESERECATDLLENCGVPDRSHLPFLREHLRSKSGPRVYWCSTLLGRMGQVLSEGSERSQIQAALCDAIRDESIELAARERAAWAIGELGCVDSKCRNDMDKFTVTAPPRLKRLLEIALST